MSSKETTFTSFTREQAAAYAANRGGAYPRPLYEHILSYHNGPRQTFLDVGTGPGKVVFDLLEYFNTGLGCDTGIEMIEQAKRDASRLGVSHRARFAVRGGEDCAAAFPDEQVDLITVAMAAHWLSLPAFYASAAQALRPGGTLAIWTCSSTYIHPSTPNHAAIQAALSDLEDGMLKPYQTRGNALSRTGYDTLDLPWTQPGEAAAKLFDRASFQRKDWDREGVPSAASPVEGGPGPFLLDGPPTSVEAFAEAVSSASMVVRWREANPRDAHTERDPVWITAERLREASGAGGGMLRLSPSVSLLLMRRV